MNTDTPTHEPLPTYGEKPARPGLYLGLLHGRDHPQQQMDEWGFNGPMVGPLRWCHTTYTCTIRIAFESSDDGVRYFGERGTEHCLEVAGDLLAFGGKYYGDWTVYYVGPDDCKRPVDSFRRNQRGGGHWAHSVCLT